MPHNLRTPARAKTLGGTVRTAAERRKHPLSAGALHADDRTAATATELTTSRRMKRVRRAGTAAELLVREALSRHGIRYRVSNGNIYGSPDLANRRRGWAIFVHGCFWHRHAECPRASMPARNSAYWQRKFDRNVHRDAESLGQLRRAGWRVYVVWECRVLKSADVVARRIVALTQRGTRRG